MNEKYFEIDGVIYEDEVFSNPNWKQPIDHPTTFSTNAEIASKNIDKMDIGSEHTVLECSCGPGEYLYHLQNAKKVDAVEIHQDIIDLCPDFDNTTLHCMDFLKFKASEKYDRIIFSPPLKDKMADGSLLSMTMLAHAWPMLKKGGKMMVNFHKDTEDEVLNWLKSKNGSIEFILKRHYHKWHEVYQNSAIVVKQ